MLSIGLIPNEQVFGTLSWNLTKPLSRLSFLLGKWSGNTLVIWFVAVVLADLLLLIVALIGFGGGAFPLGSILLTNLLALLPIAFWVLFCLLAGVLLKEQAAIGATAMVLAAGGAGLSSLQMLGNQPLIAAIAPYYPTNVIDGFVAPDGSLNFSKLAI